MDWNSVLVTIVESLFGLALSAVSMYVTFFLSKKVKNEKFRDMLEDVYDIIQSCVIKVNQTFVNSLKKEGKFDIEAQKEAFKTCLEDCQTLLSEESKTFIISNYGDLEKFLTVQIESTVNSLK